MGLVRFDSGPGHAVPFDKTPKENIMQVCYIFVHNMPGYLPEADPECYDTWEDAKSAVIDYLDREGDHYFDSDQKDLADECSAAMEDLNLVTEQSGATLPGVSLGYRQGWSTVIGNVAYSITPDWHDHDDNDDE